MIYFDYAATTPIDEEIINTYASLLRKYFANPSSNHILGSQVDSLQTRARQTIASFLHVDSEEVIFTAGASEANNLAIKGIAFKYANRGKHLITSSIEHHSVLNTFKQLEEFGFEVSYLPVNSDGVIELETLKEAIRPDTLLVSLMHVNNETGSINKIDKIGKYLKDNHPLVFFHSDMTQSLGKIPTNLEYVDLASMSAHKIYGFKGSGLLIKKKKIKLTPLISGGSQEFGYRAGTSNWPINVVLSKTIRLALESLDTNYTLVKGFNNQVREAIKLIDGMEINSPIDASPYILNIHLKNKKSAVIAGYFEQQGICVSTTSACSSKSEKYSHVINAMFNDQQRALSSIRISFSKYTKQEEVDCLIEVLKKATTATK